MMRCPLFWLCLSFLSATERLKASIRHRAKVGHIMHNASNRRKKKIAPFKNLNIHFGNTITAFQAYAFLDFF